jgi:DME family drug/metabolite transporter
VAGRLLIVLAALTWGTTGATMVLVARVAPVSPLLVGFVRVAVAAPALLLAARLLGGSFALPGRGDRAALLLAGVAMAGFQVCYFWGVAQTSVAVGSLVAICSAPLWITVLAAAVLGERVTGPTWAALGAGVLGAALLTAGPRGLAAPAAGFLGGVLLALGAGLCYGLYAVLVKAVVHRVPPLTVAAVTFGVAAGALAPVLLVEPLPRAAAVWPWLLYLGLVPTALAYVLYVLGMRRTPVSESGVLTLVEPLTATALGVVWFGDRLGVAGGTGTALLLGAVTALILRRPPPARAGS